MLDVLGGLELAEVLQPHHSGQDHGRGVDDVFPCEAQTTDQCRGEVAADLVGIGERAAHRLIQDLVDGGYVTRSKVGRRNTYEVHLDRPLRHPLDSRYELGTIFGPISAPGT